jgi:hypothetical protein
MSELTEQIQYSRITMRKLAKVGSLVATILMTGGCVYVFLLILLFIHRACCENGEAVDDVVDEDERNAAIDAAIDAGLTTKVRSDVMLQISVYVVLERAAF